MKSCKEVTYLLSEAQDRPLGLGERLQLEIHLAICRGCSNYRKQLDFLRAACQRHPAKATSGSGAGSTTSQDGQAPTRKRSQ